MISTLNVRGGNHESCQDSIFVKEDEFSISGGVFDGCSTGTNSAWASQTLAYLYSQYEDPTDFNSTAQVFLKIQSLQKQLQLTEMNFLSTCLLFYYNKVNKKLCFRSFGDGFLYVNDVEYNLDQNNEPDYLAYILRQERCMQHLADYIEKYPKQKFENVNSFKVCSDGIERVEISQFKDPKNKNPMSILLHPPSSENYLKRMWNILKKDGYTLSDDLSIISYVTQE
jgi:hypothetical protein